jgi:hypothetical protein
MRYCLHGRRALKRLNSIIIINNLAVHQTLRPDALGATMLDAYRACVTNSSLERSVLVWQLNLFSIRANCAVGPLANHAIVTALHFFELDLAN